MNTHSPPISLTHNYRKIYRNYCSANVLEKTREFHRRTEFWISWQVPISFHDQIPYQVLETAEWRDSRLFPESDHEISIPETPPRMAFREGSPESFSPQKISDQLLYGILNDAFLATSNPNSSRRPYASAGALYPIEIFLVLETPEPKSELKPGLYHLLSCERRIIKMDSYNNNPIKIPENWGSPTLFFIYVINLRKAVFKYRFRGYRHALMEAGAIYQQVDRTLKAYQLSNRCWSGFCDSNVAISLNLNRDEYLPVLIQFGGKSS